MKGFQCRACGQSTFRSFVNLNMSPLANSYVTMERQNEAEKFYPLHVYVCENCKLVQLAEFETPETIFCEDYAYYSSFSSSWLKHAERYTDAMIARFGLDAESHVAEVASNDGYLLQYFVQRGLRVTGVEPARACALAAEEKSVHTEVQFWCRKTAKEIAENRGKADLIAANNVLAHVPDIQDFVGGFEEMLKDQGVATFEFPHLLSLITHNQFDTIYHEHFSYLALGPLQAVFKAQGLRIFDVEELPTHGGSLRVYVCKPQADHAETPGVGAVLAKEAAAGLNQFAVYDDYAARVVKVKNDLLSFLIEAHRTGKTVAGYGAPAKGNTLLNYCGVGPELIPFTVDRNPVKQNTLLPGNRIPVLDVAKIERRKPDYLLILPWNIKEEIMEQMSGIRSWGGKFVVAIPEMQVL